MQSTPKVCVIVPTWNHRDDVLNLLSKLLKSNTKGFTLSVCVVDNGSTDGAPTQIIKKFPDVKLIQNETNLGFVRACNTGMKWAIGSGNDYVALINDDTEVHEDLIKNILSLHQKDDKAGAISAKIYFAKGFEFHKKYKDTELGKVIWYAGGKIDWNNVYGSNRGVDEVDHGQYDKTEKTDFATGCFVMFKAEALKKVGYYNEKYFAYLEDVEHSQRLIRTGWKVLYHPKGYLWHKVSQSSAVGSETNDYFLTRNRMLFGLRYAPFRAKLALIRESLKLILFGRKWQKIGISDFYMGRFGRGSWK